MRRSVLITFGLCLVLMLSLAAPASAQSGFSVSCDDGGGFDNGVQVTISQMRSGFTYTATAIGLNGFDPVLAVLDSNSRNGLCTDDDSVAAGYSANLPSTGNVPSSNLSSQVRFAQTSGSEFADISLVVGGYGNTSGEFLLILEGMAVTAADNAGDPFLVDITPGMINSDVPLTIYMIAKTTELDPLIEMTDENFNIVRDDNNSLVVCDDAGNASSCWGQSVDLSTSTVSTVDGRLGGGPLDSMLGFDVSNTTPNSSIGLLMTTANSSRLGQYVMVFHMGTSTSGGGNNNANAQNAPTQVPNNNNNNNNNNNSGGSAAGFSVSCDDGGGFDNGVQVTISQMRSGFTYTATAIGLNGFDPVLAVLDSNSRNGLCTDDDSVAAGYSANLPSTGNVPSSNLSSQVRFAQTSGSEFADISLVVGGYGNTSGEFLLILEGMAVTAADNAGDPFLVDITPGMANSNVPLTVYMIAKTTELDPLMDMTDENFNIVRDDNNNLVLCDDAGNASSCWGQSVDLSGSSVSTVDGRLGGGPLDSMLAFDVSDSANTALGLLMTTANSSRLGQYVMVFHMGIGTGASGGNA
jgi:hypothetical protein